MRKCPELLFAVLYFLIGLYVILCAANPVGCALCELALPASMWVRSVPPIHLQLRIWPTIPCMLIASSNPVSVGRSFCAPISRVTSEPSIVVSVPLADCRLTVFMFFFHVVSTTTSVVETLVTETGNTIRKAASGLLVGTHLDPNDDDKLSAGMLGSAINVDEMHLVPDACRTTINRGSESCLHVSHPTLCSCHHKTHRTSCVCSLLHVCACGNDDT